MNKQECVQVAETIHAMWNKTLPENQDSRLATLRAWFMVLEDTPADGILKMASKLAEKEQFMPPVGIIKQRYLSTLPGADPIPAEAWNAYCQMRDQFNTGTTTPQENISLKLVRTIKQVGLSLHTNQDRQHFIETYNSQ